MARMTKERLEHLDALEKRLHHWFSYAATPLGEALNEVKACWAERDAVREAFISFRKVWIRDDDSKEMDALEKLIDPPNNKGKK